MDKILEALSHNLLDENVVKCEFINASKSDEFQPLPRPQINEINNNMNEFDLSKNKLSSVIPLEVANIGDPQFSFDMLVNALTRYVSQKMDEMQMVQVTEVPNNKLPEHIPLKIT